MINNFDNGVNPVRYLVDIAIRRIAMNGVTYYRIELESDVYPRRVTGRILSSG